MGLTGEPGNMGDQGPPGLVAEKGEMGDTGKLTLSF